MARVYRCAFVLPRTIPPRPATPRLTLLRSYPPRSAQPGSVQCPKSWRPGAAATVPRNSCLARLAAAHGPLGDICGGRPAEPKGSGRRLRRRQGRLGDRARHPNGRRRPRDLDLQATLVPKLVLLALGFELRLPTLLHDPASVPRVAQSQRDKTRLASSTCILTARPSPTARSSSAN